jgi:D-serine dehydratase
MREKSMDVIQSKAGLPRAGEVFRLEGTIRGMPPGQPAIDSDAVAGLGFHPADGRMSLPVMTMDLAAFAHNRDAFLAYVREHGAEVAPHAKTPMSPDLQRSIVEAGAWGTTVADIRQAQVMLEAGLDRLVLANGVGGPGGAQRLARLLAALPTDRLHLFADSIDAVAALDQAWRALPGLPVLNLLVEVGSGRTGTRTTSEAEAVADRVAAADPRLRLAGVATYEAAVRPGDVGSAVEELIGRTADMLLRVRARLGSGPPLVATAGGSQHFDRVVRLLGPATREANATLVLRSGAVFFGDHGMYDRGFAEMDQRSGFHSCDAIAGARQTFLPTLRVWAEVLSRPEPQLALCGMGMRDVSFDQGFPVPVAIHRGGRRLDGSRGAKPVVRLNDQHAFMALEEGSDVAVGDVVEFGISHPCTCFDRYRVLFGLGPEGRITEAFRLHFG